MKTKIDLTACNYTHSEVDPRIIPYLQGKSIYDNIKKTYAYCKGVVTLNVLNDNCAMIEYANTGRQVLYSVLETAFSDAKDAGSKAWQIERCFS